MTVLWLILFAAFLAVEGATVSLTSIWFAGGALAGLAACAAGGSLRLQLALFVAVSFLLLLMVRPFASRYVHRRRGRVPEDSLTGRQVVVKERIDGGAGRVTMAGEAWLARSASGQVLEPGQQAVVTEVRGAKLIVEPVVTAGAFQCEKKEA